MSFRSCEYGVGDNSYTMAGKLTGITKLVDEFYNNMDVFSESKKSEICTPVTYQRLEKSLLTFCLGGLVGRESILSISGVSISCKHIII